MTVWGFGTDTTGVRNVQPWAKPLYKSTAWRKCRAAYVISQHGLCERCSRPGSIVHHKTRITPANLSNPSVTLNWDNLQLLCLECHNRAHAGACTAEGLEFDEVGNIVRAYPPPIMKN